MLNASYTAIMKDLGKLVYLYDQATANVTTQNTLRAATMDQWADASVDSLPATDVLATRQTAWKNAINSGPTALQSLALTLATAFFESEFFVGKLITNVPASDDVVDILQAWKAEMEHDSKTFTTVSTTGVVHFLNQLLDDDSTVTWPQSGSASYTDGTYVTASVI